MNRRWRSIEVLLATGLQLVAACSRRESPSGLETAELVHQVSGRQEHVKILYGIDGVRYERPDGTYLLRFADRTVAAIDAKDQSCRQTSLDGFLESQQKREHQPDLPDVSSAERSSIKVEQTSERASFADLPAHLVRITADRFQVELWLSEKITLPGPRRPTFEFLQALGGPLALPAELFESLGGFPVRSVVRAQGGLFDTRVMRALLSEKRIDPPADAFAPPPGCR